MFTDDEQEHKMTLLKIRAFGGPRKRLSGPSKKVGGNSKSVGGNSKAPLDLLKKATQEEWTVANIARR